MIDFATKEIREFVRFIGNVSIPPVELYIIPDYDTIETPDGVGFACYIKGENKILVAGGITDEEKSYTLSHIAHEYYHHIEHSLSVEHDENEAEAFADEMTALWRDYKHFQDKFSNMFTKKEQTNIENY